MYESLKRIYKATGLKKYLTNAVKRGYITEAQKAKIIAEVDG